MACTLDLAHNVTPPRLILGASAHFQPCSTIIDSTRAASADTSAPRANEARTRSLPAICI
eukprot:6213379-Pleurochrysis_carterae.AAC.5